MSDGKDYEIFVQRLHQALLHSEQFALQKNIQVQRNKRIIDNCSIARYFDLYWEYELAGITYRTVIECKDYASRISVDRIDALIGKIRDIPDLKPVFATKTGYQRGAKKKAKHNGVDLLIVREQRAEDWQGRIRQVTGQIHFELPLRITRFRPVIDREWVRENTNLKPGGMRAILDGLNTETLIEDVAKGETYSLYDLAQRLDAVSHDYGLFSHEDSFEDAYLMGNGLKFKMVSYQVEYVRPKPILLPIDIDFSKEIIGVIEYLSKGSSVAIFRDNFVKDWK